MLCAEALVSCSQEGRLQEITDSDPTIKQTVKIICNSFHSGQMSRYNDFIKTQKKSSVNTED